MDYQKGFWELQSWKSLLTTFFLQQIAVYVSYQRTITLFQSIITLCFCFGKDGSSSLYLYFLCFAPQNIFLPLDERLLQVLVCFCANYYKRSTAYQLLLNDVLLISSLFKIKILLNTTMIDRTLSYAPVQQESYYFQLIPLSLSIINPQSQLPVAGTTYRFTVLKGQQKFDENRIPIQASFTIANKVPILLITTCRLNFYIPTVNRQRKVEFTLKMIQRENNEDYEVGSYGIDVNKLVTDFKQNNVNRHELKVNFSQDYELQFQIYIDTSRVNLEKNIRDKKFDRASKSPLRSRRQGDAQGSGRKNFAQEAKEQQTPSKDVQVPVPAQQQQVPAITPIEQLTQKVQVTHRQQPRPISTAGRSQKNEKPEASVKSKGSLPVVQTKLKPISKIDAPAEIKMTESQRMGKVEAEVVEITTPKSHDDQSLQQKIFLSAFLAVGMLLIFWAMHPNSRV